MKDIRIVFVVTAIIIFVLFGFLSQTTPDTNYEKATKDNTIQFDTTNEVTAVNKYVVKDIEAQEMAKIYYNDYKSMIINYPDEAYDIITTEDITTEEFDNYRNELINNYYSYEYDKYSYYVEPTSNLEVYTVTDTNGIVFSFKIHSVMQYEVNIEL